MEVINLEPQKYLNNNKVNLWVVGFPNSLINVQENKHLRIAFLTKKKKKWWFSQQKYTTAFSAAKPAFHKLDLLCTVHEEAMLQTWTTL